MGEQQTWIQEGQGGGRSGHGPIRPSIFHTSRSFSLRLGEPGLAGFIEAYLHVYKI